MKQRVAKPNLTTDEEITDLKNQPSNWTFKSVVKIFGIVIAVITIVLSYKTYEKGEEWKKTEFAVTQFREFQNNNAVRLVNQILDYDSYNLPFFRKDSVGEVDTLTIINALLVDGITSSPDPTRTKIRKVFDEYFDELSFFDKCYKGKVIDSSLINTYINYQIRLIADTKLENKNRSLKLLQKHMWAYIDHYDFKDVQELCKLFGYDIVPKKNSNESAEY